MWGRRGALGGDRVLLEGGCFSDSERPLDGAPLLYNSSGGPMSKIVRCREVGVDCDFEARGETEQEVLQKCAEHAKSAHGMDQIPTDLAVKVRASIHDEEPQKSASSVA